MLPGILLSLVTFTSNIPVIFVTFQSHRFEEDSAAKVIASLAASDIVNRVMISCCAGMAWSLQRGAEVPVWLLRLLRPVCIVSMFVSSLTWMPCLSSNLPLLYDLSPTLPSSLTAPYVLSSVYHLVSEHCSWLRN